MIVFQLIRVTICISKILCILKDHSREIEHLSSNEAHNLRRGNLTLPSEPGSCLKTVGLVFASQTEWISVQVVSLAIVCPFTYLFGQENNKSRHIHQPDTLRSRNTPRDRTLPAKAVAFCGDLRLTSRQSTSRMNPMPLGSVRSKRQESKTQSEVAFR